MHYSYNPSSEKEKFALQILNILTENNFATYFVGGMVRDLLLHREVTDIDIATAATPAAVLKLLSENRIEAVDNVEVYGVITAQREGHKIEITTFRQDAYENSRYPKVEFAATPEADSTRRDFTINALYLDPRKEEILDYHQGLVDLKNKLLRFIGNPRKRIKEDPLRIVRAHRFKLTLGFNFEPQTDDALRKLHYMLKNISANRIFTEINKVTSENSKLELEKVIHNIT